jgi:hypothetical protein
MYKLKIECRFGEKRKIIDKCRQQEIISEEKEIKVE